jgi:hypothetical protein
VHFDCRAVGAVLPRAATVAAFLGSDPLAPLQRREVAQRRVCDEHDVTAVTAVAPVGAAFRHVFLAPKREAAVAAASSDDVKRGAVAKRG